jgi:hypothetical protein
MQKLFISLSFISALLLLSSFKPEAYRDSYKDTGTLGATVNDEAFTVREKEYYRAMLLSKTNALAIASERTVYITSLQFFGNEIMAPDSSMFTPDITVAYTFNREAPEGDVANLSIELHHNFGTYYLMPGDNVFKVTHVEWSADKTHLLLSAEYDCEMRKQGFPIEMQPIARLKGTLTNIDVSVPPWIAGKLNTQASLGQ